MFELILGMFELILCVLELTLWLYQLLAGKWLGGGCGFLRTLPIWSGPGNDAQESTIPCGQNPSLRLLENNLLELQSFRLPKIPPQCIEVRELLRVELHVHSIVLVLI